MSVVLDSWAIMRLLEGAEPAASRVQEQLDSGTATMSWINLGEVLYVLIRSVGSDAANATVNDLEKQLDATLPDRATILEAAAIKARYRMSYADAFAAATAVRLEFPLWTGDPELTLAEVPWTTVNPSS
ncbi:putative nucleic acid-binding protein [Cryobacterium mesophilum]|uniref:Type II toxin-antitoxin system VapC family toxin n=1 Tax=Terrimesophilobacter mesophilus TaxID=433647 RepID=A0A4R8VBI5_9MICO|nr:PIN domain-containing protein [Terrimesophilobacter mesophilus]MBB5632979.1 putative nucleic acid-binding protein [Terrimesophilobacter mesophilus]TFB79746.1 type II toxin-antitoxin system VapC family toxin [Terrimesophilobacter mesophilus]